MQRTSLSIPEIAIIGGTRAALGAGAGLLLADRLSPEQRKAAGWALLFVGVISTIPILAQLAGSSSADHSSNGRHRRLTAKKR